MPKRVTYVKGKRKKKINPLVPKGYKMNKKTGLIKRKK